MVQTCMGRDVLLSWRPPPRTQNLHKIIELNSIIPEKPSVAEVLFQYVEEGESQVLSSKPRAYLYDPPPAEVCARRVVQEPCVLSEALNTPFTAHASPSEEMRRAGDFGAFTCRAVGGLHDAVGDLMRAERVGMKKYAFVRQRKIGELGTEWQAMSPCQKRPWEEVAAEAKAKYDAEHRRYMREGGAEPKRPAAAYYLWVAHLRETGRILPLRERDARPTERMSDLLLFREQYGDDVNLCLTCPRPVLPGDPYLDFCEYCFHKVRCSLDANVLARLQKENQELSQACSDRRRAKK